MEKIRLISWNGPDKMRHEDLPLHEAAALMKLRPEEVEWAIEEYGRCDTDEHTAWKPSDEAGWEFPTAEAP